jgi:hypothetical protein
MKTKIMELLTDALGEIGFGIRHLCGKPSPMKRFIIVSVIGCVLGIAFCYTLVTSIYNIGKNDGRQINIEHIKSLELKDSNDSINFKQKVYEQSDK